MEASANERLHFGKMGYGCKHYRRRCRIRAPCCNEVFSCRHCHNEATSMLRNFSDRHEIVRQDVSQVICSVCDTEQPVAQVCTNCGVSMGEYFCEICRFYDDDTKKGQFHCDDCGICRIGGRENFFHCKKCGFSQGSYVQIPSVPVYSMTWGASFSTKAGSAESSPTEAVKELYDKMLESVNVKRSMPPNAWLWSLIENCQNQDDIELLFDILQNLRRFRLSNLHIHANFNCNLCREIAKTCVRVGALDFGKKTLCKHNVYGLSPSIGSAHHLLSYAQDHKDLELMVEILKLVTRNGLPLQPGTADIVFRICYDLNNWELLTKYSKRFAKAGVKFRKTTFDTWMTFAAKIGDNKSLWEIEKKRFESFKHHTLASGFSCVKGLLLEHKPEDAAAVIEVLNQTLPDEKKSVIMVELQKLVNEWPLDVVKHQMGDDKGLAAALNTDVTTMVTHLQKTGLGAPLKDTIPI